MDKCEWKDGKFFSCEDYGSIFNMEHDGCTKMRHDGVLFDIRFCPFCGSDIRKPEPEVIIKKSGGTWVARWNGDDYVCLTKAPEKPPFLSFTDGTFPIGFWCKIEEVEITDNIAKLRPIVKTENLVKNLLTLYGVDDRTYKYICVDEYGELVRKPDVKLAREKDL